MANGQISDRSTTARPARRARVALVAASCLALGIALIPSSSSATPDKPNLSEVKKQVEAANHAAEQAAERYLEIAHSMSGVQTQVKTLRADVRTQQAAVDVVRDNLGSTIADQLTTSPMGPTAQLLSSKDPSAFLDGLSALDAYNSNQADLLGSYERKAKELKVRKDQLRSKLAVIAASKKSMSAQKVALDKKAAESKALLARLTPAEVVVVNNDNAATAGTSRGNDNRPKLTNDATSNDSTNAPATNATGRAGDAIAFAKAQLGEPYVYGAAGPGSWDCSGLTMRAWGAAGVSLPHSAAAQSRLGSAVSTSSMQPGDLVFYYSPVSHVGIYLGGGRLLHAPHPGASVEIVPVHEMPINSVRRVG